MESIRLTYENASSKNFKEFSDECYQWTIASHVPRTEIECNLNGLDVNIVLTRLVWDGGNVKIPNRINISSNDERIEKIFKEHLWQPSRYPNWNKRLWVFKDDPNVIHPNIQYELRFFASTKDMKDQLDNEEPKKKSSCIIS